MSILDKKREVIERIEQVKGIKHSDEQMNILMHNGGMVIVACAGSGKTTVLTELLAVKISCGELNPNELLCTTYSKDGSLEIEVRYKELMKQLGYNGSIKVKTLHASYYEILNTFGIIKNVCSNGQRKMLIIKACKEAGLDLGDEEIETLNTLIGYQINNLMSDKDLVYSPDYTLEDVKLEDYISVRKNYNKLKEQQGLMDFDDMQLWMYALLKEGSPNRQQVISYCRSKWKYYLVDEFQDTSKIQFKILQALVEKPEELIVIGDDDQCIYKWRGADPSIILNIGSHYDIKKFLLPTNYRCCRNIVEFAARGIKSLSVREDKTMVPFHEGGNVRLMNVSDTDWYEISKSGVDIVNKLREEGVNNKDICIMVRNNVHALLISNILLRQGIYCDNNDNMKISNYQIYKDYKNIIELMENTYNYNLVRNTIWRIVPYLGAKGASIIYDFMDNTGVDLKRALLYLINRFIGRVEDLMDYIDDSVYNIKIPIKILDRIEYKIRGINKSAVDGLIDLCMVLCGDNGSEKERNASVKWALRQYSTAMSFVYKRQDSVRMLEGFERYFLEILAKDGIEELKAFMNLTEQYENSNAAVIDTKINVTTMHSAKGLEWQNVIVLGCDNISFPNFEHIQSNLDKGIEEYDLMDYLDGERRLHYVAMTRAKENLYILGNYRNLCMYTLECLGVMQESKENNDIIIRNAKAGRLDSMYYERMKTLYTSVPEIFMNDGGLAE